jgi:hypothetical protein
MATEKQKFRSEAYFDKYAYERFKDRAEKDFILETLFKIDIDKLKDLLNFTSTDPDTMCVNNYEQAALRNELLDKRAVKLSIEIEI